MLFDYYGFPEHTYQLELSGAGLARARGARARAARGRGIASRRGCARGYDHGVFVPFLLMFPDADIPVVQLSLRADLDPAAHLAIGRALAPLRDEGVLIVGSGMSYHNLRRFWSTDAQDVEAARAFDAWLAEAVETPIADAREREARRLGERARRAHGASAQRALAAADGRGGRRRRGCRPTRVQRPRVRQGRFRASSSAERILVGHG